MSAPTLHSGPSPLSSPTLPAVSVRGSTTAPRGKGWQLLAALSSSPQGTGPQQRDCPLGRGQPAQMPAQGRMLVLSAAPISKVTAAPELHISKSGSSLSASAPVSSSVLCSENQGVWDEGWEPCRSPQPSQTCAKPRVSCPSEERSLGFLTHCSEALRCHPQPPSIIDGAQHQFQRETSLTARAAQEQISA